MLNVCAGPSGVEPALAIRHLKKTMRLTTAELAKLAGVRFRTLQDMEQQRSEGREGSVQTMDRMFALPSLKLGVVRAASNAPATPVKTRTDGHLPDQA